LLIKFLGTGTSHGVPVVGCSCKTCTSSNPKNKRMRSSIFLEVNNLDILIDTTPELRLQMLNNNIDNVDLVLFTHAHADHIMGFDDIRVINWLNNKTVPCFGNKKTINHLRTAFDYIFNPSQIGGGIPQVTLNKVKESFVFESLKIEPLKVKHGKLDVYGYKIKNIAYITDCSFIPEETMEKIKNIDLLILDALRFEKHPTHMNLEEALAIVKEINPKKTFFTHISHEMEHDEVNNILPTNVKLAYDGLQLKINKKEVILN